VTPGWIESEMSKGKFLKEHGGVEVDQEFRDVRTSFCYNKKTIILRKKLVHNMICHDLLAQRYT
jgi:hypothetical protein